MIQKYLEFDKKRNFGNKSFKAFCYAPYVSLMFDPLGCVRACCQSLTHSYGNITQQRLSDIWHGSAVAQLRKQMVNYELPKGCTTCKFQVDQENFNSSFSRNYDHWNIDSDLPLWPKSMEFLLSNTCNLECVQCYGEVSSSIRKNRENLPPLPKVYDDQFFEDLRLFLPHLEIATFLGGEPFLSKENFRIWDMMIEDNIQLKSSIITNGTVYNKRVERILDSIPSHISISMDGATKSTVERVRKNSKWENTIENVKRFAAYTKSKGTDLAISFCLMPQNHGDFLEFLFLADELECRADVNIVNHPLEFSFNGLSIDALSDIVKQWEQMSQEAERKLKQHLGNWKQEFMRLRNQLDSKLLHPPFFYFLPVTSLLADAKQAPSDSELVSEVPESTWQPSESNQVSTPCASGVQALDNIARDLANDPGFLFEWSGGYTPDEIKINNHDIVTASITGLGSLDSERVAGMSITDILMRLREEYGPDAEVVHEQIDDHMIDRIVEYINHAGKRTSIRWIATPHYDDQSNHNGALIRSAILQD